MPPATVVSVNVGVPVAVRRAVAAVGRTAIDKRPVAGRVTVSSLGLAGDSQCDSRHHGGLDKAVYAYALEDLRYWAATLGRELAPGRFGENLTSLGLDVTGAVVGERWRAGSTLLEVSCPRIPCRTFAAVMAEPRWIERFTAHGACGAYLRVVEEGALGKGDPITVVDRPGHGVTVGTVFRAFTTEPSLLPLMVDVPQLPVQARAKARRRTTYAAPA